MKKYLVPLILLSILLTACSGSPADRGSDALPPVEECADPAQQDAFLAMSEKVKLLGRVYILEDTVWCVHSGTGMEFSYTGTNLSITIAGDGAINGNTDSKARFAVYVDGERTIDDIVDSMTETYSVFESMEPQTVTVTIVKLSESTMSAFGIRPIQLSDGETITPTPPREHRIEFIGDSITCGYGVDDEVKEHSFSTHTEDVTRAYAYKTAQLLNADYSIVSFSGYGVLSGYTTDSSAPNTQQTLPQYYDKIGFSYQSIPAAAQPQELDWNFTCFCPEVIVINLGTNDASYCKGDTNKQKEYTAAYVSFLKDIRTRNASAELFCVLGVMGQELYPAMEQAVTDYIAQTGDEHIHCIRLEAQDGSLGFAADWHPTAATHDQTAAQTAEEIRTIMGW